MITVLILIKVKVQATAEVIVIKKGEIKIGAVAVEAAVRTSISGNNKVATILVLVITGVVLVVIVEIVGVEPVVNIITRKKEEAVVKAVFIITTGIFPVVIIKSYIIIQ